MFRSVTLHVRAEPANTVANTPSPLQAAQHKDSPTKPHIQLAIEVPANLAQLWTFFFIFLSLDSSSIEPYKDSIASNSGRDITCGFGVLPQLTALCPLISQASQGPTIVEMAHNAADSGSVAQYIQESG